MYYVGETFNKENGGYKTIQQAKKQAAKKGMNVFDEDGQQVYPETGDNGAETPQNEPETAKAGENTTEPENAAETPQNAAAEETKVTGVELTDDVPEGATEENEDGSANVYNAAGEKVGKVDAAELDKLQRQAGEIFEAGAVGTVTVVREGMLALRNAPKWDAGHKCGIAKTGYTARAIGRFKTPDGDFYKLETGKYISAREGDTIFTPEE